jgi:predicted component of type VI protein secretion system
MTVLKPRSRTLSIRLSEEEHFALIRLCSVKGARSLSDLTRDAIRGLLNSANREDTFGIPTDELRTEMRSLNRKIKQLASEITTIKTNSHNE